MEAQPLPPVEFRREGELAKEILAALAAVAIGAWIFHRDVAFEVVTAIGVGLWMFRRHRTQPLLVVDGSGLRMPWNAVGERFLAPAEVASWSMDDRRLAVHTRSGRAIVLAIPSFSPAERLRLIHALTERGYRQVQAGEVEQAAIRSARSRLWWRVALIGGPAIFLGLVAMRWLH